jgi:hypothetical protein
VEEGLAAAEEELRLAAEAREAETAEKARIMELRGSAQTEIVRLQAELEKRDGDLSRQADAQAALKRQVRGLSHPLGGNMHRLDRRQSCAVWPSASV